MKPTLNTVHSDRREKVRGSQTSRFPITNYNYHSVALGGYNGHCARASSPSFLNISREYFKNEARHSFAGEAAFFVMIIITAALPLMNSAHAVIDLMRAIGPL